jgi:dolichol-phosphate mannosyltransferase
MPQISLVIPAHNEAGNIAALVQEALEVIPAEILGEVIVVDDASTDGTAAEVAGLMATEPRVRLIRHATNAGQSAAVRTGVQGARFALVATIDGDGQNPPGDIPRLVAAWRAEGPQLVGGHRVKRRDGWSKRWASYWANLLRKAMLRDDCPDTGCGLKVFERERHLALPFFHGQHRYLPALFRAYGCSAVFLPVDHRQREHGRSKYTNWKRALQGVPDLMGVAWLVRRARPVIAHEERKAEV